MKIHYLEIVAADVDAVCASYAAVHGVQFSSPDALLGNARTATLADRMTIGVRGKMSDEEQPIVRPYWLVEDIEAALEAARSSGAEVVHPPLEIPGKGTFAIYIQGATHQGLWQL